MNKPDTVECRSVSLSRMADPQGPLIEITGVKGRSNIRMDFCVDRAAAEELMNSLWDLLNPVQWSTDEFGTAGYAFKKRIGGGIDLDIETHPFIGDSFGQ